jgi:hypothetical protein
MGKAFALPSPESRVFEGEIVSRVFAGDTVSRAYLDAALEEARRRVAELSNETICGSDMVGGDPDGERWASAAVFPNVHRGRDWTRLTDSPQDIVPARTAGHRSACSRGDPGHRSG